jgi:cell division transport system permease protein
MTEARSLRPRRADDLGLRRALSDRLLPLLVACMTFLAVLALAGAVAAAGLAGMWQAGAGASITVQVPGPDAPAGAVSRADAVLAVLRTAPGITGFRRLSDAEFAALLRPWLGQDPTLLSLKLPALFELHMAPGADPAVLAASLARISPDIALAQNGDWLVRLRRLMLSLQACASVLLILVAATAASMVAIATRAGLAARRDAIEILHGLGATETWIAGRFAARIAMLTLAGSLIGVAVALPVLLALAHLAAPFTGSTLGADPAPAALSRSLPPALWGALPALPLIGASVGWTTAYVTVRLWLGRLP